jgi:carbon-monoxide dehydrogenase large subunit
MTYDSGDYSKAMEEAARLADWPGFEARRKESAARGRLRGLGLANYVESTSGNPRERAEITVHPEGRVDLVIGTLSSGQGHETSFAQCLVEWLGVPFESIRHIQGDTDIVPVGGGSHSGRSMRLAGIVMGYASDAIVEKGRKIAAHVLEAAPGDIAFAGGRFTVSGTDRSIGLFDAARAAADATLPPALRGPLAAESDHVVKTPGFPYGSHVCEVEVDPDTGMVELVRYAAVDDVGRAVNPLILHGQAHGGIAQGVGQALIEHCHYDLETGQLLSATLMDYGLPRADMLPSFATALSEVPTPTNRLGVRAGGEGGTTPALGVVVNAVADALAALGVHHIDMPLTPNRVWQAVENASSKQTKETA